jgi:hypothetical protein
MTTPGRWLFLLLILGSVPASRLGAEDFSPSAMVADLAGNRVFVAGATGGEVEVGSPRN